MGHFRYAREKLRIKVLQGGLETGTGIDRYYALSEDIVNLSALTQQAFPEGKELSTSFGAGMGPLTSYMVDR